MSQISQPELTGGGTIARGLNGLSPVVPADRSPAIGEALDRPSRDGNRGRNAGSDPFHQAGFRARRNPPGGCAGSTTRPRRRRPCAQEPTVRSSSSTRRSSASVSVGIGSIIVVVMRRPGRRSSLPQSIRGSPRSASTRAARLPVSQTDLDRRGDVRFQSADSIASPAEKELAMSTQDVRNRIAWLGPVAVTLFALTVAGVQYRHFLGGISIARRRRCCTTRKRPLSGRARHVCRRSPTEISPRPGTC